MSPEVAVASHACAHIGAIQVPIFSGFAAPAVAQRLQRERGEGRDHARESSRRGKRVPMLEILEEARRDAPSVEHVVARAVGRARRRLPGRAARARGRLRDAVPAHLHVRHDRRAEGRRARAGRLPRLDRARGLLPGRRPRGRRRSCFATDMGWIMGPWTVVGVGALGGTVVYAEGAPDWPRRPALADGRAGAHHVARPLADARPRAAPARRRRRTTCRRCARS